MYTMIYVYHRDKSPVENQFDYSNGQVRILVTFYDRVVVTLSSDNYIGHEKRKDTFYYSEPCVHLPRDWNLRWSGRAF